MSAPVTAPLDDGEAEQVAHLMRALATPSRVRILGRLRERPHAVGELAAAVSMAQPAVSHQLRVLRELGLVVSTRDGRRALYELHDDNVASLLDDAARHVRHLVTGRAPDGGTPVAHAHVHEHRHGDITHVHAHSDHTHRHPD